MVQVQAAQGKGGPQQGPHRCPQRQEEGAEEGWQDLNHPIVPASQHTPSLDMNTLGRTPPLQTWRQFQNCKVPVKIIYKKWVRTK